MSARRLDKSALIPSGVVASVLALLPFHALFTTWIGSNIGYIDLVRIWKELIIVALIPTTIWLLIRNKTLSAWFHASWLPRLIILYILLSIVLGSLAWRAGRVNASALIYGLLANLRFVGFFLITLIISTYSTSLKRNWKRLVIIPLVVVVVFGLLQRFILPYDFLKHFGYGPGTIPAFQTVDQKLNFRRIQSTLRGANPLGAYLVLAIPFVFTVKQRQLKLGILLGALLVLAFTYSRSAWIGVVLAAASYGYISITNAKVRRQLSIMLLTIGVLVSLGVMGLRHNAIVQNTFFHTDNSSRTSSSNTGRVAALESGLRDVIHEPLGNGIGTAGPASARNPSGARIAENYYLQIGQEAGWLGLALFLSIVVLTGLTLWRDRANEFSRALLSALIGISFVNLLSHAWADDTLGLLWWGLAGIALAGILKTKHHDISTKKKTTA